MSKFAIWRRSKNLPPMSIPQSLYRDALSALFWIVICAVGGVVAVTILGELVVGGVIGNFDPDATGRTDEALSILAQIGSGAVGAMAGWLARDRIEGKDTEYQELPPEPTPDELAWTGSTASEEPEVPLRIEDSTGTVESGSTPDKENNNDET